MAFSYSNFGYKQTNTCAVAYLSQRCLSVQVWGEKKIRTVGEALLFKKQNRPNKKETTPLHIQLISFSSQLNMARAKAVPIPLCHPTPLLQNRNAQKNSFVCCLHTRVRGLGGHKGVWRIPTASLFRALHSLSHNQVFFPFLTFWICFHSQVRLIFSPQISAKFLSIISVHQLLLIFQEHTDSSWGSFHTNYHTKDTSFSKLNITNLIITATPP